MSAAARRSTGPIERWTLSRPVALGEPTDFGLFAIATNVHEWCADYESVLITKRSCTMASTQPRHDDIIIRRRFGEHPSTHIVKQIYAVTYPGHTDDGAERENYGEAEEAALGLAQEQGRSVWYEESPHSGRRTLVKSFRASD
jgi:formylglycine-generating enzyme required for sulfatase activity